MKEELFVQRRQVPNKPGVEIRMRLRKALRITSTSEFAIAFTCILPTPPDLRSGNLPMHPFFFFFGFESVKLYPNSQCLPSLGTPKSVP